MNHEPPNPEPADLAVPEDNPFGLPLAPCRGQPVSAAMLNVMLAAARKGGWDAAYAAFAEGRTVECKNPNGNTYTKPARVQTLRDFLQNVRPDVRKAIDEAAQTRRHVLVRDLENAAESIALGPPDKTTELRADGSVARVREDNRNKLYAILKLLASHSPETHGERRKVDVSGNVAHTLTPGIPPGSIVLRVEDLELLQARDPDTANALWAALDRCHELVTAARQLPASRPLEIVANG